MNKNKHITFTSLVALFGIVLFAVVLLGCPTAAPTPKAKDKGGDGDGEPEIIKDVAFSLLHTLPNAVMAQVKVIIDLDSDITFAITSTDTKPTASATASTTDGIISRKFTKGQTREVYMAQLSSSFIVGGTPKPGNATDFMQASSAYYLHLIYTKAGAEIHEKLAFSTLAYDTTDANNDKFMDQTAVFDGTGAADGLEWKRGSENFLFVKNTIGGRNYAVYHPPDAAIQAQCVLTNNCYGTTNIGIAGTPDAIDGPIFWTIYPPASTHLTSNSTIRNSYGPPTSSFKVKIITE